MVVAITYMRKKRILVHLRRLKRDFVTGFFEMSTSMYEYYKWGWRPY